MDVIANIFAFWMCFRALAYLFTGGAKADGRFKTGYKYNQLPAGCLYRIMVSLGWLALAILTYSIGNVIANYEPTESSSTVSSYTAGSHGVAENCTLYKSPDNTSEVVLEIQGDRDVEILRSTKYFHKVRLEQDGTVGYVLKENVHR